MNNDIEFECVPNALFKTYGTKKEKLYEYLHSVHEGGSDDVNSDLNRNTINDVNTEDKVLLGYHWILTWLGFKWASFCFDAAGAVV